jgi:hypothetical protein
MNLSSTAPRGKERCSVLEFAALVFLCAPLMLFFATFTPYPLAAVGACSIMFVLWRVRPERPWRIGITRGQILLCVIVSALFLWACGFLAPAARTWDWIKHFAVINELGDHAWPPVNETNGTFLRYYLGFYLLPGLAAKLLGERVSYLVVFAQAWAGLSIVLALMVQKLAPRRPLVFLTIVLLFSGLDLVGYWLSVATPKLFEHKEWWAAYGGYSYQGLASHFIWAPQHVLAGLLALLLVLPDAQGRVALRAAALLFAALAFWSPFAALGLVPFALAATRGSWKEALADRGNLLCGVAVGLPVLAYLLAASGDIARGINWQATVAGAWRYAAFVLLEFGALLAALRLYGWQHLRHPVIVTAWLLVLPLFTVGLYNDLAMRASIPALALLAFAAAAALSEARSLRVLPLALLIAVGAASTVLEMIGRSRDGHVALEDRTLRSGFLAEDPRYARQYAAPLPHWTIRH